MHNLRRKTISLVLSDLTSASPKYVVNLGAVWTLDRVSINLRETVYGKSSEYVNDGGATAAVVPADAGKTIYYEDTIGVTPITSLDVSYQALEHVRLSAGAVNLLNRYPNKINATRESYYNQAKYNSAVGQYPSFSPFGFDGGFYYVRASYSF